jgi:hypothetical protein
MRERLMMLVMLLSACTEEPVHKGKVTDRWGKPIAGVTIGFTGSSKQLVSNAEGGFSLPVQDSEFKVRAGKPGFIKNSLKVAAHIGDGNPDPVLFALYPDPEHSGFYAVGNMNYSELKSIQIQTMGTDIRAFNGLSDMGKVRVKSTKPAEFLFSSEARRSELKQLGLQLHRLKFLETDSLPGVLGETEVTLNLWVSDTSVPFDLTGMETDDDYTIKTRGNLEPGMYAFHTQGILSSTDPTALDKLPKEMRVAFPFEVR